MAQCVNHPEREAGAVCRKHGRGFCAQCCECRDTLRCCGCLDPKVYCAYRTQCLIWELSRERRKAEGAG
jgi:hypothetical protein